MLGETFRYDTVILERHLDSFGHVNNAVYLELFEAARWELITDGGLGLAEVQRRRTGPVVLDVHLRLRRELRLRDRIRIDTTVTDLRRKIFKVRQEIFNEANASCTEALFTFGILHLDRRELVTPDSAWRFALRIDDVIGPAVESLDTVSTSSTPS